MKLGRTGCSAAVAVVAAAVRRGSPEPCLAGQHRTVMLSGAVQMDSCLHYYSFQMVCCPEQRRNFLVAAAAAAARTGSPEPCLAGQLRRDSPVPAAGLQKGSFAPAAAARQMDLQVAAAGAAAVVVAVQTLTRPKMETAAGPGRMDSPSARQKAASPLQTTFD